MYAKFLEGSSSYLLLYSSNLYVVSRHIVFRDSTRIAKRPVKPSKQFRYNRYLVDARRSFF